MKVTRDKNCYCHTCQRWFHYLGINSHTAAHVRRGERCKVTYTHGNTVTIQPFCDDVYPLPLGATNNPATEPE